MGRIVVAFVALWWAASGVAAQDLTERQQKIARTALASDGWLTETEHRAFWADVSAAVKSDPAAMTKFALELDRHSASAGRFQRAVWESLDQTIKAKGVVRSRAYEQESVEMLKSLGERGVENAKTAEAMFQAAASGKPFSGPDGQFYISQELVDQTLAGLDGSLHRSSKLQNPTWQDRRTEQAYPSEHVRVLWDGPFSRRTDTITTSGGVPLRLTMLDYRVSEADHVAIGYGPLPQPWSVPETSIVAVLGGTLKGMGMITTGSWTEQWRGRLSAMATGSITTANGPMHAAVRIVEGRELSGVWQIMAVSGSSLPDAIRLRDALEASMHIPAAQSRAQHSERRDPIFPNVEPFEDFKRRWDEQRKALDKQFGLTTSPSSGTGSGGGIYWSKPYLGADTPARETSSAQALPVENAFWIITGLTVFALAAAGIRFWVNYDSHLDGRPGIVERVLLAAPEPIRIPQRQYRYLAAATALWIVGTLGVFAVFKPFGRYSWSDERWVMFFTILLGPSALALLGIWLLAWAGRDTH